MKLEVFFDYACPYCLKGYESLVSLLPEFPFAEVDWRPCEAHPRPESYGRHSDLLARAMLFARDRGTALAPLHERLFRAALVDRADIDDPEVVAGLAEGLLDTAALLSALKTGSHQRELAENNRLAWSVHAFAAVPSLVMEGKKLGSVENIGLTTAKIRDFLR